MEDFRLEQTGQEVQDILNGATMQSNLTAEVERAQNAESTLQGNIDAEETRAKAVEKQNADDIDAIEEKIPSGASSSNKLTTEEEVNDKITTATATFKGTFNLIVDLHLEVTATHVQIADALLGVISSADNNDYCFVQIPTSNADPNEIARIERYKFNGDIWAFEYTLNNSGFTAAQWAAINSGITSNDKSKLDGLPNYNQLMTLFNGKQNVLTFDTVPTQNSTNPVTSGGIYDANEGLKTLINDKQNKLTFDNMPTEDSANPVTSGGVYAADALIQQAIQAILILIPSAASALNQLADKAFVNSSIETSTAVFRGTFNLVSDLSLNTDATHAQIATALLGAISNADNNDYAFVQVPTSASTPTEIRVTERYKFNGTIWQYEYDLNNSGFTAAQWEAINSGITALLVTKLGALPTNSELVAALAGKQAVLTFDQSPTINSANPVTSNGIYQAILAVTNQIDGINSKIPAGASSSNKLVAEDRLAAYVAAIIGALDATYNVTSTDGHVTVKVTQVDGAITNVDVLTNDIASASALTTLTGRVSTNETDIANLQAAYAALTQSDVIIINGALPSSGQQQNKIYRQPDQNHTPPQFYSDYMWNGSDWVLMATYNNAIDDEPTAGSNNLVKSGGVSLLNTKLSNLYNIPYLYPASYYNDLLPQNLSDIIWVNKVLFDKFSENVVIKGLNVQGKFETPTSTIYIGIVTKNGDTISAEQPFMSYVLNVGINKIIFNEPITLSSNQAIYIKGCFAFANDGKGNAYYSSDNGATWYLNTSAELGYFYIYDNIPTKLSQLENDEHFCKEALIPITFDKHGYISEENGNYVEIPPSVDNYICTDFVEINQGDIFAVNIAGGGGEAQIAYYDENKIYQRSISIIPGVNGVPLPNSIDSQEINMPINGFVRFTTEQFRKRDYFAKKNVGIRELQQDIDDINSKIEDISGEIEYLENVDNKITKVLLRETYKNAAGTMGGFTVSSANKCLENSTQNLGITNAYVANRLYSIDGRITTFKFQPSVNCNVTFGYKDSDGYMCLCAANFQLGILCIYNMTSDENYSVAAQVNMDIPSDYQNNLFMAKIVRHNWITSVEITDLKTGSSIGFAQVASNENGYLYGSPIFTSYNSAVKLFEICVFSYTYPSLRLAIYGDSITDGYGATSAKNSWSRMALSAIKNGVVDGRNGGTLAQFISRETSEIDFLLPQSVILAYGHNDLWTTGDPVSQKATFEERLSDIYTYLSNKGIELILACCPLTNDQYSYVADANEVIMDFADTKNLPLIRFDIATAINNDIAQGFNSALFYDATHPNDAGYKVMYERVKIDVPQIFIGNL